ncbi:hypothetical protein DFJ73DRAFT_768629 [Zopfochytrium polystomum]|nr:hypothetical protein DFJ73DRAFT_768629 [Zopfochytrium polystomum]
MTSADCSVLAAIFPTIVPRRRILLHGGRRHVRCNELVGQPNVFAPLLLDSQPKWRVVTQQHAERPHPCRDFESREPSGTIQWKYSTGARNPLQTLHSVRLALKYVIFFHRLTLECPQRQIRYNRLTGAIPPELGSLTSLQFFDASQNELTGSIPPELGLLTNLTEMWLNDNQLAGGIPPELGNMTNLSLLKLQDNFLSGPLPNHLAALPNVKEITLSTNRLNGVIPPEFANTAKLTLLDLTGNYFSGDVPMLPQVITYNTFGNCLPLGVNQKDSVSCGYFNNAYFETYQSATVTSTTTTPIATTASPMPAATSKSSGPPLTIIIDSSIAAIVFAAVVIALCAFWRRRRARAIREKTEPTYDPVATSRARSSSFGSDYTPTASSSSAGLIPIPYPTNANPSVVRTASVLQYASTGAPSPEGTLTRFRYSVGSRADSYIEAAAPAATGVVMWQQRQEQLRIQAEREARPPTPSRTPTMLGPVQTLPLPPGMYICPTTGAILSTAPQREESVLPNDGPKVAVPARLFSDMAALSQFEPAGSASKAVMKKYLQEQTHTHTTLHAKGSESSSSLGRPTSLRSRSDSDDHSRLTDHWFLREHGAVVTWSRDTAFEWAEARRLPEKVLTVFAANAFDGPTLIALRMETASAGTNATDSLRTAFGVVDFDTRRLILGAVAALAAADASLVSVAGTPAAAAVEGPLPPPLYQA